jgi:hypothetical protein
MTIEKERLLSLIEYAQQSARLRTKPVSTITQHNEFALYEHQLRDRPGISLNIEKGEGEMRSSSWSNGFMKPNLLR